MDDHPCFDFGALNLTVGATLEFGDHTDMALGYIAPICNGPDQQLDGGFRVMLDYRPSHNR